MAIKKGNIKIKNPNTGEWEQISALQGEKGERGGKIYKVSTAPSSYSTVTGGVTPTYRIALSTVKTEAQIEDVIIGDVIQYSYYHYPVIYVDGSYAYTGARQNMRGSTGAKGADGLTTAISVNGTTYAQENGVITLPNIGSSKTAYGTCSTEASVAEKEVVIDDPNWTLEVGSMVVIKHSATNSASNVKINVNNTGAYPIWANNAEYTSTSSNYAGYANRIITYIFNGTHWVWVSQGVYPSSTSNASLGHGYGVCSTAEATLAKACTISNYSLVVGGSVSVKFENAVPANSTLNIRTRGAKKIFYKGVAITDGVIKAGDTVTLVYDGTQYQVISIDRDYSSEINSLRNEITGGINEIVNLLGGDA